MSKLYQFETKKIDGTPSTLKEYKGEVLLIVNVASACGLTPQYQGLQSLYDEFHAKGFEVLGFPCNQFGGQEPGTEAEIVSFCSTRYEVSFPLFAKLEVNGASAHPLYRYLKETKPGAEGKPDIEWNFAKFLVNRQGEVVERFSPRTEPSAIKSHIEALL